MTSQKDNQIADAIKHVLTSPNVADSNYEPANVVDTLDDIATSIKTAARLLGAGIDGHSDGALHEHGSRLLDGLKDVSLSLDCISTSIDNLGDIAGAIRDLAQAIREHGNTR